MMEYVRTIIYVGQDEEFLSTFNEYCREVFEIKLEIQNGGQYQSGVLVRKCAECSPHIVYLDISDDLFESEDLFNELAFIKRHKKLKKILIVGIFSGMNELRSVKHLFTAGIQYSFIKGNEISMLHNDSFYIGLDERTIFPKYAKVEDINKQLKIGLCSTISSLNMEYVEIETDLESNYPTLPCNLPIFEELHVEYFEIKSRFNSGRLYPSLVTYHLSIPYAGPWGEVDENTIQEETVETWIDFNQDGFDSKKNTIMIFSTNMEILGDVFDYFREVSFYVDFDRVPSVESLERIKLNMPSVLFFDLPNNSACDNYYDDDENYFGEMSELINEIIYLENYDPIFVIMNCSSKCEAVRKTYEYPNILSVTDNMNIDILKMFIDKTIVHENISSVSDHYFFKKSNPARYLDINLNVILTNLTEHEITFHCEEALPMFCVLHLILPVECFVTVIPPLYELEKSTKGFHYMGFIHGIDEEEQKLLRKFVNQMIYKPIDEFTCEAVTALIEQKELEVSEEGESDENADDLNSQGKDEKKERYVVERKIPYSGKSKL